MRTPEQQRLDRVIDAAIKSGVPGLYRWHELELIEKYRMATPEVQAQMQTDARRFSEENPANRQKDVANHV